MDHGPQEKPPGRLCQDLAIHCRGDNFPGRKRGEVQRTAHRRGGRCRGPERSESDRAAKRSRSMTGDMGCRPSRSEVRDWDRVCARQALSRHGRSGCIREGAEGWSICPCRGATFGRAQCCPGARAQRAMVRTRGHYFSSARPSSPGKKIAAATPVRGPVTPVRPLVPWLAATPPLLASRALHASPTRHAGSF